MRPRRVLTIAACLLSLAVAGCGGGGGDTLSKKDYENKVNQIVKTASPDVNALSSVGGDPTKAGAALDKAQAALKKAGDDLGSLKPPKDVASDNQKLATALRYLGAQFGQLKAAVQKKDTAAVQKFAQTLSSAPQIRDAQTATQDLKKKGYDVGQLGG